VIHQRSQRIFQDGQSGYCGWPHAWKATVAEKKGFKTFSVDMSNPASIHALAEKVTQEFPNLNVVIHNAGIAKAENLIQGGNSKVQEEIVLTNFLGPMRLTDALLRHLLKQGSATIMTASSGLAFVPNAFNPTYSATKAALHSYSQSLRFQLKDTSVKVIEIVPPYVQTRLGGEFLRTCLCRNLHRQPVWFVPEELIRAILCESDMMKAE
jgi:uncharacterized oxidoreductase